MQAIAAAHAALAATHTTLTELYKEEVDRLDEASDQE